MSETLFFSVNCFHKAAYRQLKASSDSIAMGTITVLSHKAQNSLTANYQHTMATHIHKYYYIRLKIP
jgi:hypothetical protein